MQINLKTALVLIWAAIAVIAGIISFYLFAKIDYIVNSDLYDYGLLFSLNWAGNYGTYSNLLLASIGTALTAAAISAVTVTLLDVNIFIKTSLAKTIAPIAVPVGVATIAFSVIFNSPIFMFAGLGLLFGGILFANIHAEDYVKTSLLEETVFSQGSTLNQIMREIGFQGPPIYLSPKYFRKPEIQKIYVSEGKELVVPSPEQITDPETQFFLQNPSGVLLTPTGAGLERLFEKTLKKDFMKVDIQYLREQLPTLLIENLELARKFEIKIEGNLVSVRIEGSKYPTQNADAEQFTTNSLAIAFPLSSAIACALAKTTNKCVVIEKLEITRAGRDVYIDYRILND